MSDVLTDEQLRDAYASVNQNDSEWPHRISLRAVESAVVAALAAKRGVDVEALAHDTVCDIGALGPAGAKTSISRTIRLALATAEARHEAREAMWRELRDLRDSASDDDFLNDYRAEREASEKRRARVAQGDDSVRSPVDVMPCMECDATGDAWPELLWLTMCETHRVEFDAVGARIGDMVRAAIRAAKGANRG